MSEEDTLLLDRTSYVPFESTKGMFRHLENRLSAVEAALSVIETERAVSEEKRKFMEARFNAIDGRLDKIDGHVSRLVWLIIAAILGGLMSLAMQGNALTT
ncbi:hypothetical protein O4H61_16935 [Roseovarius aestuarii]|nr:hypothetical protein [Roseovarius aestuarii]